MIGWQTGEFRIDHGLRCASRSLDRDAMFLVMEGLRLIDESRWRESVRSAPLVEDTPSAVPLPAVEPLPEPPRTAAVRVRTGFKTALLLALTLTATALLLGVAGF